MAARITADNVRFEVKPLWDGADATAFVRGLKREFVVDCWQERWYCTCGHAPTCAHIRATREVISR